MKLEHLIDQWLDEPTTPENFDDNKATAAMLLVSGITKLQQMAEYLKSTGDPIQADDFEKLVGFIDSYMNMIKL